MRRELTALIDEARCIGCTRCIEACPVDAIVGARQLMHTVVDAWCIGCRLCVPPCPVDCIDLPAAPHAFSPAEKSGIARRARMRKQRLAKAPFAPPPVDRKAVLAAILSGNRK